MTPALSFVFLLTRLELELGLWYDEFTVWSRILNICLIEMDVFME